MKYQYYCAELFVLQVLIVSYETLRTLQPYLAAAEIGLLLCDEGHRLKNGGTFVPSFGDH